MLCSVVQFMLRAVVQSLLCDVVQLMLRAIEHYLLSVVVSPCYVLLYSSCHVML